MDSVQNLNSAVSPPLNMRSASKIGRPAKGKAAIMQVYEERYQGVTTFVRGQLITIAIELIEAYAGVTNQCPGPCGTGSTND